MKRMQFTLSVILAAMLGALICLVDASPGWDDTGVSVAMVLGASGLMGALHPQRAWVGASRRLVDSGAGHHARSRICLRVVCQT